MGRSEPLAMLTRYAGMVLAADAPTDCHLQAHIAQTTIDLVALALGAEREEAVEARGRGLKTARIAAILREITAGFADAEFTVADVAAKLRLSERTIQDLLQETGEGFASRVLQLRLQFAAKLLAGPGSAARKISDIANASGFNDLSYFHRCYRRRFGMTPAGSKGATSRIGIERFQ